MKSTVVKIIIALVFLIIFNVIFFVGDIVNHSPANWCAYGFVTASYVFLLLTPLFAKGISSAILEGSLWLRSLAYFFLQLIIGIIIMCIDPEKITWPLIIQSAILGVFIVMQAMSVLANDATEESIQVQKDESFERQILIDDLQLKARQVTDPTLKMRLNRCLDALNNSPIQTLPEAFDADNALRGAVNNLCMAIDGSDEQQIKSSSDKVIYAIQERNIVLKRARRR